MVKIFNKKDKKANHDVITTFLCPDTVIEGIIKFTGTIRLDGKVKGDIYSSGEGAGTVIVGKTAKIEAELKVDSAIIIGAVKGRISAKKRIELYPPGKVDGDMDAPIISIASGAVFNGKCSTVLTPILLDNEKKGEKMLTNKITASDLKKNETQKDTKNL
ncbi:MAG: polymer-forming cytoskeletal protein [Deltaproteobacteria bacterium]|nr:polymer-forming cytoskeletal protein [Deltaproteobacteria bacterium]